MSFLKTSFDGGLSRKVIGWGRWYWRQRFLTCRNQDFADGEQVSRTCQACWWRGSPGRWQIMLNKDSWRRCKTAVPGKVPDMKWTRGAGDLVESFKRDWTVLLYCWSNVDISVGERNRLAKPDISTGVPYNDRILSDAAGLDLLLLARPHDIMEPNAFLKDENLWRRLGRFPSGDLLTPPEWTKV